MTTLRSRAAASAAASRSISPRAALAVRPAAAAGVLAAVLLAGCAQRTPGVATAPGRPVDETAAPAGAELAAAVTDGIDPDTVDGRATDPAWVERHYLKSEHMVEMRDGVRLFTQVHVPRDAGTDGRTYPIIMRRTPYSCRPYGEDAYRSSLGPEPSFGRAGYIVVYQDVRGCYMSEGDFENMRPHVREKAGPSDIDESTDTWDTIDWLVKNVPGNNGRVGLFGISYPGFYAAAGMIDAHPALKAVSPQAPIGDWWYDDIHHHGAFFLPHTFNFFSRFGLPRPAPTTSRPPRPFEFGTPDGYHFFEERMGPLRNADERFLQGQVDFWQRIVTHPNYDAFWQARSIVPHLENVAPAVMTVGGWFDAEDLYGPLAIYRSTEEKNPNVHNVLVMGPWDHGGWNRRPGDRVGDPYFGGPTSPWFRETVQRPFFDHFLKGEDPDPSDLRLADGAPGGGPVEAIVFETGTNRWRTFDDWPPRGTERRTIHVGPDERLLLDGPPEPTGDAGYDAFTSDLSKPVPFVEDVAIGMPRSYMTDDQRFAARRPDVLTWWSEPLEEDLTIAGPITATLWVSTSGTASDWVVKLIDEQPHDLAEGEEWPDLAPGHTRAGYMMLVRSEVIRGRFRDDPARPEPFVPDRPTRIDLPLQDVLHTFRKGHRIAIQIQSSWFPLVDRNPHRYVENIFLDATEADLETTATQRVYRTPGVATRIEFGALPPGTD